MTQTIRIFIAFILCLWAFSAFSLENPETCEYAYSAYNARVPAEHINVCLEPALASKKGSGCPEPQETQKTRSQKGKEGTQ